MNLSLEFGSSGAPGRFKQYASAAEVANTTTGCLDSRRSGEEGFGTKTWVDDAVNSEADLGRRAFICDRMYEVYARAVLGATAISLKKKLLEGALTIAACVWGIDADTEDVDAAMPDLKMQKFAFLVCLPQFAWGSRRVPRGDARSLRGMGQHVSVVLPNIINELANIDAILGGPRPRFVLRTAVWRD